MKILLRSTYSTTLLILSISISVNAQDYRDMMYDNSYNFYDVCDAADAYFETHSKGKGSGYKEYQRWKAENESKYYPDGDRSDSSPLFAWLQYNEFVQKNNSRNTWFDGGWRDLGPYSANLITEGYNPGIGRVESFYVDPNNTQLLYMGARGGGFWRSTDEGASWINTTDFLPASGVNTIAVSPTNPDSLIINIQSSTNYTSHGIYRSVDGGLNWTLTGFNPSNLGWGGLGSSERVMKIVYHPTIPDFVLIGTTEGLYRSTDNLNTWTVILSSSTVTDIEFHPTNPGIVYVYDDNFMSATPNAILTSTDSAQTFTASNNLSGNNNSTLFISTTPSQPNFVYAASANGVYRSDDEGVTFSFLTNPNQACRGFIVSDLDTTNMIYGYLNLEASFDGGYTFFEITDWSSTSPGTDYVHADLRTAECINGVFYVGTDGYLAKSTDNGQTWTRLNDGTGIREFYAIGVSQSNWLYNIGGSQDNGTSINHDLEWLEWNGGDGMEGLIQPLNDQWMMGSWQYGSRQRTKDGGMTRHGVNTPQSGSSAADWEAPLLLDPVNQMRVYHFASDIYKSDRFGDNWEFVGSPNINIIREAAIAYNNSDIIAIARNGNLRISTNGGTSFQTAFSGLPTYVITDIAFDPNDDSTLVVTYNLYNANNKKIYVSHDLGASWQNITYNLGSMPLRCATIDFSDSSYIYVGAEIGVYYKSMEGTNWQLYNPQLPNVGVRDLEIHWGTNALRAATYGRGLWDYTLVGRIDHPSIVYTTITDPPTDVTPYENIDQFVTSRISYEGSLSNVYVKWSVNSLDLNNTIPMTNTVDSTWVSNTAIPNFPDNSKIYFKVYAVGDSNDTTETYRFMYEVLGTSDVADFLTEQMKVYPNPNNGSFTLDMGELFSEALVEVTDISGRLVYSNRYLNFQQVNIDLDVTPGKYFVRVTSGPDVGTAQLTID